MWKNIAEWCRTQIIIWHIRIACWITKATNTHTHPHRLCNTHCLSTAKKIARTPLSITLYVHCLSCSWWREDVLRLTHRTLMLVQQLSTWFARTKFNANLVIKSTVMSPKWPLIYTECANMHGQTYENEDLHCNAKTVSHERKPSEVWFTIWGLQKIK